MIERALIEYIANALWQIPLLAAAAWLFLQALKPNPLTQHRTWLATLALATLLPLHGMGASEVILTQPQQTPISIQQQAVKLERITAPPLKTAQETRWLDLLPRLPHLPHLPSMRTLHLTATAARWLIRLYLGMLLLRLYQITRAWRAAHHLTKHSTPITHHHPHLTLWQQYSQSLGVRLPQLRESCEISSPMLVGIATPILLLPEDFICHSADEIKAALCHELAHLKRRDCLTNLICQLAALPISWNPVTYWIQQRIRRTREIVCDAIAANQMRSEIGYAKCLLALAQNMLQRQDIASHAQALGLFSNNILEERIMQLTETRIAMSVRAKVARVTTGAAVMIAATAVAAMVHVSPTFADSKPAPLPETAQAATTQPQPAPQAKPAPQPTPAPAPQAAPKPEPQKATTASPQPTPHPDHIVVINREHRNLTPEEQERLDKQMAAMSEQIKAATDRINSAEIQQKIALAMKQNDEIIKVQMPEIQLRIDEATAKLNTPEFQKQMADLAKNSALRVEQMAKMQEKMQAFSAKMNSPEFQKQINDAVQKELDSLDLERSMQEAAKDLQDAQHEIDSAPKK